MYFLLDACQNPGVLRIIYFVDILLNAAFTLIPIGLIAMLLIDFSKAVIMGNDDKVVKETKIVIQRIINAILVFSVPWIVSLVMNVLNNTGINVGSDYLTCISNARSGNFAYYDKLWEEEEKELEEERNNKKENSNSSSTVSGNSAADRLMNLVKGELGNHYQSKYGGYQGQAWCGYFVAWALKNTNLDDGTSLYNYIRQGQTFADGLASGTWPGFQNSNNSNIKFYKAKGYGGNYTPKKGDIVYFQWPSTYSEAYCQVIYGKWNGYDRCADHVGIVEYADGNTIHTIEGNTTADSIVARRERYSNEIVAYGSWY